MWDCFELLQVNETQMETYLIEKNAPTIERLSLN